MAITLAPRRLNKIQFFEDIGYKPHPGQWKIHESAANRRVVACGVRWGKTLCAAIEGLTAAMEPRERSFGWVVAPTYDLASKVFREIVIQAVEHLKHRIVSVKESEQKIVLRNMAGGLSEIKGKSADNPVSLLGEGLDWVIVDEAARLKPAIWESHLTQRLIDKKGWALLISTPRGKGWLYDLFRRGQGNDPDHESWNLPSWTNPHLDAELIEGERNRLPERVFRQEFGGEFLEGSGAVFRNVRECAMGEWKNYEYNKYYYGGLDLAKVEDFSVLVIMDSEKRVVFCDRFNKIDWALQIQRVKVASDKYDRPRIYVDSTGKGEPVFEELRRANFYVSPYTFTAKSKAALIDHLAILFEKKEIVIPKPELWPVGIDELESFQYQVSDQGNVSTSAPGGQHDDCVVALALAAWKFCRPCVGAAVIQL